MIKPTRDNTPTGDIPEDLASKHSMLRKRIEQLSSALVAYSGGVDSTLLLKLAADLLGDKAMAVTAVSETSTSFEAQEARQMAADLGVTHLVVETKEMDNLEFVANTPERCYFCKRHRFEQMVEMARANGIEAVLEGSNASDQTDFRPGFRAVKELGILSPLREAGLTKDEVRALSRHLGLPTWDRPANPCLATRIPYGSEITRNRLRRIEQAEAYLRDLGIEELRVRDHDDVARIEVPRDSFDRLLSEKLAREVTDKLRSFGYRFAALDLVGFRSGSMNEGLKQGQDE